jgi:hypothetical protein
MRFILLACATSFPFMCCFEFVHRKDRCRLFAWASKLFLYVLAFVEWYHALGIKNPSSNLNLYYFFFVWKLLLPL